MLMLENGENDPAREEENDHHADLGTYDDAHEEEQDIEYCDPGVGPILVCAPTVLSVQPKPSHEQRCNLFHARAHKLATMANFAR